MSDNNNFFDDDDLFGEFDDEPSGNDGGGFDLDADDDFFADEDLLAFDEDEDPVDFDEEDEFAQTGEGPSRTFIAIAAILIIVLLGGFALIAAIVLGNRGPSEREQTATSIVLTNNQVAIIVAATEAQNEIDGATQTAIAAFTDTPSPTPTETETPTLTPDTSGTGTAIAVQTQQAGNDRATATAVESTRVFQLTLEGDQSLVTVVPETPITDITIPTEDTAPIDGEGTEVADGSTPSGVDIGEVAQTATALANPGQGGGGPIDFDEPTPTRETGIPDVQPTVPLSAVQQTATALANVFEGQPTDDGDGFVPTATPRSIVGGTGDNDALPDTGLFDDVFSGSPLAIFAMALGLLGVIVVSRGLRKRT